MGYTVLTINLYKNAKGEMILL